MDNLKELYQTTLDELLAAKKAIAEALEDHENFSRRTDRVNASAAARIRKNLAVATKACRKVRQLSFGRI